VAGPVSYLDIFQRRWKIMVLAAVIGVAAGWLTTPSKSKSVVGSSYTATSLIVLEENATPSNDVPLTLSEMAARTTAGEVPKRVAARLGPDEDPVALAAGVNVRINDEFGTISITASDRSGPRAADVANGFAEELVTVLDERAVARHDAVATANTQRLAKLKAQIEDVSARLGTSRNDVLSAERDALVGRYGDAYIQAQDDAEAPAPSGGIAVLQAATPVIQGSTGIAVPASGAGRAAIGGAVGLALGLGLSLLAEQVDTRLGSKGSVEKAFGLPVIAEIPPLPQRLRRSVAVVGAGRESSYAESFRQLRTSIVSLSSHLASDTPSPSVAAPVGVGGSERRPAVGRGRVASTDVGPGDRALSPALIVLVTSAGPGEGKTTVATNLGAIFAETATSVLVLDCDFRHPAVNRMFELPEQAADTGATDTLPSRNGSAGLDALSRDTSVPGLRVATVSGSGSSVDALAVARSLLAEARRSTDVVVIDSAPLLTASVAAALVPDVDAVVVVARAGTTTADAGTEACERLARLEAPVFGVALVNAPTNRSAGRYYRDDARRRLPRLGK
jgi:Mrp family chromosome partitioning ATPase